MICVGLLIAIRITGTAALRGCMDLDAGLASGTAGLELVGVPGDSDSVLGPGAPVVTRAAWGPVWRCLEFVTRSWVCRCLEFELGAGCASAWSLRTRSRSGRSQEKRASLLEQQRLASGNVSSDQ